MVDDVTPCHALRCVVEVTLADDVVAVEHGRRLVAGETHRHALGHSGAWRDALQSFWYGFWSRYVTATGDQDLVEVAAPFFAWRGLVLANPKWYPELRAGERERLLGFVEKVLDAERFSPAMAEEFFDT